MRNGLIVWVIPALVLCGVARAQEVSPMAPPNMADAALRAMELGYLSDEERAARRVFHGVWTGEDLEDTRTRAKAALLVGALFDPSLSDDAADPLDRAEALVQLGQATRAMELIGETVSARALRLKSQALEILGDDNGALLAANQVIALASSGRELSAQDLVEVVRAMRVRADIEGRPGGEYEQMIQLLARAQQDVDRLYWPALVEQAEILDAKDNRGESRQAATEALALNPRAARAWHIAGLTFVSAFDFDNARKIAARLDKNIQDFTGSPDSLSLHGAELRARTAIRLKDGDLAREILDRAQPMYPGAVSLGALRAAAVALKFDEEDVERALADFDNAWPGSALALYEVGRALAEARQYGWAARMLERAIEREPNWARAWVEKGLLEVQAGRDELAIAALRRGREMDPFNSRARNSLTLLEELATYDRLEGDHFVVRFKPGVDEVMARDMLGPLDEMHEVVSGVFGWEPADKTLIELMPDHEWFAVRIVGMPGVHTIAASTGPVVAMEVPKIGKKHKGVYDWIRVVRHEYAHTITLGLTNNRIPHWFTEAAAVQVEFAPRDYTTWQLLAGAFKADELFNLTDINIAFVRPKRATDRAQAYAQGHWMYQFIVDRWGEEAPLEMMRMYAQGATEGEAFQSVLGVEELRFFEMFKVWAEADLREQGMLATPTIQDLIREDALETEGGREKLAKWFNDWFAWMSMRMSGVAVGPLEPANFGSPTLEQVQAWAQEHPDHPDVLALRIEAEIGRRPPTLTEAHREMLEHYASVRTADPMPHQILARYYLQTDDPQRAVPHLEYLDAREQRTTAYAVELARLYAASGDLDKAWAKAVRATSIAPFDGDHRELAATIALQRRDLESAEDQLVALRGLEPGRTQHEKRLDALRRMREAG